ncbi:DUF4416 family protein [Acidobacteriota bacterium]
MDLLIFIAGTPIESACRCFEAISQWLFSSEKCRVMMKLRIPAPVTLIVGAIYGEQDRFEEARNLSEQAFGPVDLVSEEFQFDYTDYYEKEMGAGLKRIFMAFKKLLPREHLVDAKLETIRIEAGLCRAPGRRTVNLDPGYLALSKLVLATTKGYSHRLYLGGGVYGDVHLIIKDGKFEALPWTYPDYKSHGYQSFFLQLRTQYSEKLKKIREEL